MHQEYCFVNELSVLLNPIVAVLLIVGCETFLRFADSVGFGIFRITCSFSSSELVVDDVVDDDIDDISSVFSSDFFGSIIGIGCCCLCRCSRLVVNCEINSILFINLFFKTSNSVDNSSILSTDIVISVLDCDNSCCCFKQQCCCNILCTNDIFDVIDD
ncbi:hypothetical protein DERP_002479 [Dermatophagoides pteronyssinus]|uniref:Uncharacterized protein n=1 Tax=Dermatophagoides pteronyssinus TaxID=6956 RepID=A0ABQ8JHW5_DERPT|nr:hypothetical protein DERP_002479 [Dermatophagoides pteronyssinus]